MQTIKPNPINIIRLTTTIFIITLLWGFGIGGLIIVPLQSFNQDKLMTLFVFLFTIPFALISVLLTFLCILIPLYDFSKKRLFNGGTLLIDKDKISPGDDLSIQYQQTIKANLIMDTVTAELIYYEWESHGEIKSLIKKEHIIDRIEEKNLNFFAGQQIVKEYRFTIPENARISYKSKTRLDSWKIKIKFKPPKTKLGLGFEEVFEFEVT